MKNSMELQLTLTQEARNAYVLGVRQPCPDRVIVAVDADTFASLDDAVMLFLNERMNYSGIVDLTRFKSTTYPCTSAEINAVVHAYIAAAEDKARQDAEDKARKDAQDLAYTRDMLENIINGRCWHAPPKLVPSALRDLHAKAQGAYDTRQAKVEEERERREAMKIAERKAREQEKVAWSEKHGSEFLRTAIAAGYDCQRRYVTERAAAEYPGFHVDFDNRVQWKDRACPTEAGLEESLKHEGSIVMWITRDAQGLDDSREAVVIRGFLGQYDLLLYTSEEISSEDDECEC